MSLAMQADDGFEFGGFLVGLGRGVAGALLFALPMFMTMEMWELGFYVDRDRLFVLLILNIPLLVFLSDRVGFERTSTWMEATRDAIIAYAIGILTSALVLFIIAVLSTSQPLHETVGQIAVQSVPASIGALLARSQLDSRGGGDNTSERHEERETSYGGELFMMAIGALFLSLNVAPTEEMILIAYRMSPWHALVLVFTSLIIMHSFVYVLSFRGGHQLEAGVPGWHALVRFTLPGYVVAMAISIYCLWTFHRLDDVGATQVLLTASVLSFPGAIGAAAARLIL
jgi:putative integral membrane protein (TIGR02587 family)